MGIRRAARAASQNALTAFALVAIIFNTVVVEGCSHAANRRVIKDITVVLSAPIQIPAGAVSDTINIIHSVDFLPPALRRFPIMAVGVGTPIVATHYLVKHTLCALIHAADIPLYPVASLFDWGALPLYDITSFPFRVEPRWSEKIMTVFYTSAFMLGSGFYGIHLVSTYGWWSTKAILYDTGVGVAFSPVARVWWAAVSSDFDTAKKH